MAAAILDGAFIQTTELDCYHSVAAFFSLLSAPLVSPRSADLTFTGLTFPTTTVVGFETGPHVGKAIYGGDLLTRGWHSGPMFGSENGPIPPYRIEEVVDNLGSVWHIEEIRVKLYDLVGGCHGD